VLDLAIEQVNTPIRLVLRNGMNLPMPVSTVRIDRIAPNPKRKGTSREEVVRCK
jgi:hypothetical protein